MKGIILLCFLIGNFIFGQNISIQYAVEKNGYHQDFILDVLPSYSFFYSTEYCTPKEEEIFNYIKVENTKQGIIFHDEIENIKVYYKSNIKLKWELLPETQIYEGVKLNKARTKYKNVEYVAWYDSNAAVNEGPFIFKNLPGVIYKVESEGIKINLFKITNKNVNCVKIPSKEKKISKESYENYNEELLSSIKGEFDNMVVDGFEKSILDSVLENAIKKDLFREFIDY